MSLSITQMYELLAVAAAFDATVMPAARDDRMVRATLWREELAFLPYVAIENAIRGHYREETRTITVADILRRTKSISSSPSTYLEVVRANPDGECEHGELRGAKFCPLCRRRHDAIGGREREQIDPRLAQAAPKNITQTTERNAR